ncbi:triose-phosphate isomerase [Candidatus Kaiserbacteria bacterium CG10_big_fil_rev_8_21_14_0_10_45_20]|uniref:Triosephosphate isomerase n=1 Tax=Candidatus Kaiserbacteria bacterium CG10_big_fil_rev_8_21_14_0_10_45_20 TaxID=1974607 RepID=A0A2H0UFE5_9BACT|nr:MAG: triose-phosphate isomerase [Candidatus Kaiserbacteria bacterium CG10_big_fil_rev_8_21_14_0_10_45_20]
MKPIIVGNWKTYVSSQKDAKKLFKAIDKNLPRTVRSEVVVCPPAPLIQPLRASYVGKRISFGAQDVSFEDGTPTGDIMPTVLKDVGAQYVIIGHADKRRDGDSDLIVGEKINAALDKGLRPIVSFGEQVRDKEGIYLSDLEQSIRGSLFNLTESALKKVIIAYEPVWAIGATVTPSAREIQETNIFIRKTLATKYSRGVALKARIIYGGSVDDTNADELIADADISGFLLGRASVDAEVFTTIVKAWQ